MSQFTIIGTPLYQWESGRKMRITPLRGMTVDSVHFSNYGDSTALVVKPKEENGHYIADIPNILLQDDQNIVVYSVNVSSDKVETIRECVFPVRKRAKPSSYVYTETEVQNYTSLDKRIDKLEGEGLAKAVADYLKENPVEAVETYVVTAVKDTEHNETRIDRTNAEIFAAHEDGKNMICHLNYNGVKFLLRPIAINVDVAAFACLMQNESIGVMLVNDLLEITNIEFTATETLNDAVNAALAQAKESGMFDGKDGYTPVKGVDYFDGKDGQDGADGKDGSPGRDGVDGQPGKDGNPGVDGKTPVKGTDYFTPADVQEIAEQAAGMVEVSVGEIILLDTSVEIPVDTPITVLELELPEAAKQFSEFYVEMKSSAPTNSPANDIAVRFSVCGNNLAGSANGNGRFRKANQTWVAASVDLLRRTVLNAAYNNEPEYNYSSSMGVWKLRNILPVGERSNIFKAQFHIEYAGTLTVKILGYG